MRRSHFTGEQIVRFLEDAASGTHVRDLCDAHGFSTATFFRWKARYQGMRPDEASRFRALEEELHESRRQVRMADREREAVRVLLNEAYPEGRVRRRAIRRLQRDGGISERRACEVFGVARSTYRRDLRAAGTPTGEAAAPRPARETLEPAAAAP